MSRFNFASAGPLRSSNLGTVETTAVEHVPEPELPLGQRMVLLKLRRGELAATILEHLREMSAPEPCGADWRAMIEARYIRRDFSDSPTGRLVMMPAGLSKCHVVMRDFAARLSIHLFMRSGGRGSGLVSTCCCGWRSAHARDSRGGQTQIGGAETWHLKMVATGKWPPRSVDEFLNEVAPLQLPLRKPEPSLVYADLPTADCDGEFFEGPG